VSVQPGNNDAEVRVEFCIVLRDEGWMIEREGRRYGPYDSRRDAMNEAICLANYSISYDLQPGLDTLPSHSGGIRHHMENEMHCRVYDSEALNTMGWAFDKALEDLSEGSKRRPNTERNLALSVIQFFDEGESNPLQLSRMALAIHTFSNRMLANNEGLACSLTGRIVIPSGFERWPVAF
jgi:hypothetical protein